MYSDTPREYYHRECQTWRPGQTVCYIRPVEPRVGQASPTDAMSVLRQCCSRPDGINDVENGARRGRSTKLTDDDRSVRLVRKHAVGRIGGQVRHPVLRSKPAGLGLRQGREDDDGAATDGRQTQRLVQGGRQHSKFISLGCEVPRAGLVGSFGSASLQRQIAKRGRIGETELAEPRQGRGQR